jgi:transposase
MLVMDNASFYHIGHIEQMCAEVGVKLMYLPPYSLDLNPMEEFFVELNAFIKRQWHEYEDNPHQDFKLFLE